MQVLVCLTALVAAASAFSCPDLSVVTDFNITEYTGIWYKQYGLNTPWEIGTCNQVTYTYDSDTEVIDVATSLRTILGGTQEVSGTAVFAESDTTAQLNLTMKTYIGDITASMWVLSTDYENYAIVYHCNQVSVKWFKFPFESVWVLTRDRELTVATALLIEEAMATVSNEGGPSMSMLSATSQENCS